MPSGTILELDWAYNGQKTHLEAKFISIQGYSKYDEVGKGKDGVVCDIDFHVKRGILRKIPGLLSRRTSA